jgi:hypothetical protein
MISPPNPGGYAPWPAQSRTLMGSSVFIYSPYNETVSCDILFTLQSRNTRSAMIIDKAPYTSPSQTSPDSLPLTEAQPVQHAPLNSLMYPSPQSSSTTDSDPSLRMSNEEHPDHAPPPYEAAVASPSPRVSTRRVLRKSTLGSSSPSRSSTSGSDLM